MSIKSVFFAALAAAMFTLPAQAQHIEIHDAYAIAASPTATTGAAFMVLHNHGDIDDRLVATSSPVAQKVEFHTHREDAAGVMRMIHVEEGYDLPAQSELVFERGGNHVMFMGLKEGFEDGKTVPLTLIFEKSGEVMIEVPVDMTRKPVEGHSHGKSH